KESVKAPLPASRVTRAEKLRDPPQIVVVADEPPRATTFVPLRICTRTRGVLLAAAVSVPSSVSDTRYVRTDDPRAVKRPEICVARFTAHGSRTSCCN